ncbi:hypothetical protein BSM4216_0669 [Bacillus smithii]|jgi:hypothetical protein|nr:hypothetical protein BSM4216_0669 [Bacillus smithii]
MFSSRSGYILFTYTRFSVIGKISLRKPADDHSNQIASVLNKSLQNCTDAGNN